MSGQLPGVRPPDDEFLRLLDAHHRWGKPARYPTLQGQSPGIELRADGLDLRARDFSGMDLDDVWWVNCNLEGSVLAGASMQSTRAYGSSWRGCDLTGVQMPKSEMDDCILSAARLVHANALRLTMHRCILEAADLSGAILNKASFFSSDLTGAMIRDTWFDRVGLIDCLVAGIDLTRASGTITRSLRINVGEDDGRDWLTDGAALDWLRSCGAPTIEFFDPQAETRAGRLT